MTLHQNPRGVEVTSSSVPKFPAILSKPKEKDFRKPPKIEVAMNKRFLYKPYTTMIGDDLPELKRLEHTELADKTRSRNKMEKDLCWRDINLSFRDHQYAMAGLRQEQSLVYQLMCKVQKDKRRIQRQVHKRRELEFQNKMRWERIKDMCRFVVFKFKENAQRKKQARLSVVEIKSKKPIPAQRNNNETQPKGQCFPGKPRIVDKKLAKRPQLEMISDVPEEKSGDYHTETSVIMGESESFNLEKSSSNNNPVIDMEESKGFNIEQNDANSSPVNATKMYIKSKTESDMLPVKTVSTSLRSEAFETFREEDPTKEEVNRENDNDHVEDVNPDMVAFHPKLRVKAKVVQVRKDKSKQPLTKNILETDLDTNDYAKEKRPITPPEKIKSISPNESLHRHENQCNPLRSQEPLLTANISTDSHSHERTRRTGIVEAPEVKSTSPYSNQPSKLASTVSLSGEEDVESEKDEICHEANRKHKAERESLAMILKKRKKVRARKDLEKLNKESFVKYERSKSGFLTAFPGKREDFLPPSNKHLYTRQKLLKQERDAILRQRMKLHKFYNSVIELRDRVVVHETPPEEPKVVEDKELPLLEDTLSQMTNSIFNTAQAEKPELQDGESNRYVRVYEKDMKEQDVDYRNRGRRMSSWNM